MKTLILGVVIAGLMSAAAHAQQNETLVQLIDPNASIAVLGMTVRQAEGEQVYDTEGNEIGIVSRVLGDDGDSPTALVVNIDQKPVLLELATMERINNRIVVQLGSDQFEGLPAFEQ